MWILVIRLRDFKLRFLFHTKHSYQSSADLLFQMLKKHSPIPPCICLYAFLAANKKLIFYQCFFKVRVKCNDNQSR